MNEDENSNNFQKVVDTPALKRLRRQMTKQVLWLYLLSLLRSEGEKYGYELRSAIQERFGFEPATVTAYVVLYKLEREKLVTSTSRKSPRGRPDRKYYKITERGENTLKIAEQFFQDTYSSLFHYSERNKEGEVTE